MSRFKKISNLFYGSSNLKQAVGILFTTVLISNILGLLRNIIIANRVGVTYDSISPLDNYYAAFVLPDLLYNIIIVGALVSAILPLLVSIDEEGDQKKFWQTYNTLLSTGFSVVIAALFLLYIFLPFLVSRIFTGFSLENQEFTAQLSRVLLLSPLFFTISQISTSALQAKRIFMAPAIAPIVYNLAIIGGALLIPRFGLPVLVFGVIAGAAAHFFVQLPSLLRLGWRYSFQLGFGDQNVKKVIKLMIPRTIALAGTQLLLIIFYRFASRYQGGSIAIYRLTDDLQAAPVLLLANTLAMAILPDFARRIANNQQDEFYNLIGRAVRLLIFIFLPVTAFLFLFRHEIIALYIALGQSIDISEFDLAVKTFSFFLLSTFFQGLVLLLARAYFARSDTVHPTIYSIIGISIAWLIAWIYSRLSNLGVPSLSLAFSIGSIINACLLWIGLKLPLKIIFRDSEKRYNLLIVLFGTVFASALMFVTRWFSPILREYIAPGHSVQNAFIIILGLVIGFISYFIWVKTFNIEQWQLIRSKNGSIEK